MTTREDVRRIAEAHAASFGEKVAGTVDVTKLVIGDDGFAMQVLVKSAGASDEALPACLLYRVKDGLAIENERYVDQTQRVYPKELVQEGAR